jgi:hypothetical protein
MFTLLIFNFVQIELRKWFPGFEIPLLSERVKRLNEIGRGLLAGLLPLRLVFNKDITVFCLEYEGLALNMIKTAKNNANTLVDLILRSFPGLLSSLDRISVLNHSCRI